MAWLPHWQRPEYQLGWSFPRSHRRAKSHRVRGRVQHGQARLTSASPQSSPHNKISPSIFHFFGYSRLELYAIIHVSASPHVSLPLFNQVIFFVLGIFSVIPYPIFLTSSFGFRISFIRIRLSALFSLLSIISVFSSMHALCFVYRTNVLPFHTLLCTLFFLSLVRNSPKYSPLLNHLIHSSYRTFTRSLFFSLYSICCLIIQHIERSHYIRHKGDPEKLHELRQRGKEAPKKYIQAGTRNLDEWIRDKDLKVLPLHLFGSQ